MIVIVYEERETIKEKLRKWYFNKMLCKINNPRYGVLESESVKYIM